MRLLPSAPSVSGGHGFFASACFLFGGILTASAMAQAVPPSENAEAGSAEGRRFLRDVAISSDGTRAIAGAANGSFEIWSLKDRKLILTIRNPAPDWETLACYALSADGKLGISGRRHGDVLTLWDLTAGTKIRAFDTKEPVTSVALSPNGKMALAVSIHRINHKDLDHGPICFKAVRLWDTSSGKLLRTLQAECLSGFLPVTFSPDGTLAVAGFGGKYDSNREVTGWDFKMWNASTGREVQSMKAVESADVTCVAFSPNGKYLVAGYFNKIILWELATGKELWCNPGPWPKWSVHSLAFSPDGKRVLAAGNETDFIEGLPEGGATGGMLLLDAASGKKDSKFAKINDWMHSAVFTVDGKQVIGAIGSDVKLWNVATGEASGILQSLGRQ